MRPRPYILMAAALLTWSLGRADPTPEDLPVQPIPLYEFRGWTNAYRLINEVMEVVVVPETGRIAVIAYRGGESLLRLDETLAGKTADVEAPDFWHNFGGDWIWPVSQARWPEIQGSDWPPSRLLDGRPWQGRAWKAADGAQCCQLTLEYGDPLNIKLTRMIKLHRQDASVQIQQRIEGLEDGTIPVTLWQISQMSEVERIVLPVDSGSAFEGGIKVLNFAPPDEQTLVRCGECAVYRARQGGEHKLGSDSQRAWIAAQREDTLLVVRATSKPAPSDAYPDGGCTVEMFSNTGLGYAEVETLSVERTLKAGDVLENTLYLTGYRLMNPLDDCALAERVQILIGEKPVPADPGSIGRLPAPPPRVPAS